MTTPREAFMQEWRPIEEAPMDHLPLLVWSIATGRMVAFRDVGWKWWPVPAHDALPERDQPTHFMPLPKPPQVTNEKA
jgi:hypothetical protein